VRRVELVSPFPPCVGSPFSTFPFSFPFSFLTLAGVFGDLRCPPRSGTECLVPYFFFQILYGVRCRTPRSRTNGPGWLLPADSWVDFNPSWLGSFFVQPFFPKRGGTPRLPPLFSRASSVQGRPAGSLVRKRGFLAISQFQAF